MLSVNLDCVRVKSLRDAEPRRQQRTPCVSVAQHLSSDKWIKIDASVIRGAVGWGTIFITEDLICWSECAGELIVFFSLFSLICFVRRGVVLWEWTHCWLDRVLRSGIMETGYERINLCRFVDKLRATNTNKHTRNSFSERTVFAFCWVHMSTLRGSFIKNNALKDFHCQLN